MSATNWKWIPQLRKVPLFLRLKTEDDFPLQPIVEKLLSFLSSVDSRVKSKSFESISRLALFGNIYVNVCM